MKISFGFFMYILQISLVFADMVAENIITYLLAFPLMKICWTWDLISIMIYLRLIEKLWTYQSRRASYRTHPKQRPQGCRVWGLASWPKQELFRGYRWWYEGTFPCLWRASRYLILVLHRTRQRILALGGTWWTSQIPFWFRKQAL